MGKSDRASKRAEQSGGARPARKRLWKTGEVVRRSGFSRQVIYAYTTMGLLEEAQKTPSDHKLYDDSVFVRLKLIHDLHESGYTLRDIKQIFFSK